MPQRIAVWYEEVRQDYVPLLRAALEGQGLEVREYPHWGDLYDACRKDAPEFILLDASLDSRSEVWSTLDLLLLHKALVKTAVIVASSDFTNRDLATYINERGCVALSKPFTPRVLAEALKQAREAISARV
jgi:DNA-binding NtrC family response regulator